LATTTTTDDVLTVNIWSIKTNLYLLTWENEENGRFIYMNFVWNTKSIYQEIRHADKYMIELIMVDWTDNKEKPEYRRITKHLEADQTADRVK